MMAKIGWSDSWSGQRAVAQQAVARSKMPRASRCNKHLVRELQAAAAAGNRGDAISVLLALHSGTEVGRCDGRLAHLLLQA